MNNKIEAKKRKKVERELELSLCLFSFAFECPPSISMQTHLQQFPVTMPFFFFFRVVALGNVTSHFLYLSTETRFVLSVVLLPFLSSISHSHCAAVPLLLLYDIFFVPLFLRDLSCPNHSHSCVYFINSKICGEKRKRKEWRDARYLKFIANASINSCF